jgi:Fe(3+) dicitrate transport protein
MLLQVSCNYIGVSAPLRGKDILLMLACSYCSPGAARSGPAPALAGGARLLIFALIFASPVFSNPSPSLRLRVLDAGGSSVPGAHLRLRMLSSGSLWEADCDASGEHGFDRLAPGRYEVEVAAPGFAEARREVKLAGAPVELEVVLRPASVHAEVVVHAGKILAAPEILERHPGSADLVTPAMLLGARVFVTDEALRKVPGIYARGEEGFGLRPNIGVRGLNPTRSAQVLLLEDGLPLAYAPYGDNASYYHPPVDRFESVEVVKGGGQILFGPRTVGAVINYLTPPPPQNTSGFVTLTGGNRDYLNAHARAGGTYRSHGWLLDYLRKQGRGAREHTRHGLHDVNLKTLHTLAPRQTLALRFNYYGEDSQVTYSGLREDEYRVNPRANPFSNDHFDSSRFGSSLRHSLALSSSSVLTTSAYATFFRRDWWRQSSNSGQRPNDAADPVCGGMANLHTTCGNEGRLRDYYTWGLESSLRGEFRARGMRHLADLGLRLHFEYQERRQENGAFPAARSGLLVENNLRTARAFSFFLQDSLSAGRWTLTPGVRVERIHYERTNRLAHGGAGVSGRSDLTVAVPGFGIAYAVAGRLTAFAGIHRGFAPPRVEDSISNTTGASIDLGPELSWNFESGLRFRLARALRLEATFFRMDFENQIIPASLAGGAGATLTNGGQTLHQGMELGWNAEWSSAFGFPHRLAWRGAYTWLPTARFDARRFSNIPGFSTVSVTGNRMPYAPENTLTSSLGFTHRRGWNALLELVYTGREFSDDLNSFAGSPDGQRGLIPGNALWSFTANVPLERAHSTFFFTVKNLFDRTVIVDRARGLLPGLPRLVQAGVHWNF